MPIAAADKWEQIALLERCVLLCQALVDEAPEQLRKVYAFSASQARGHRDVIARFGRHPIATPCLAGRRPRMSERTSHPVSSFIGAHFKGDGTFSRVPCS